MDFGWPKHFIFVDEYMQMLLVGGNKLLHAASSFALFIYGCSKWTQSNTGLQSLFFTICQIAKMCCMVNILTRLQHRIFYVLATYEIHMLCHIYTMCIIQLESCSPTRYNACSIYEHAQALEVHISTWIVILALITLYIPCTITLLWLHMGITMYMEIVMWSRSIF